MIISRCKEYQRDNMPNNNTVISANKMKGPDTLRRSGPLTVDLPWEAAVFEGCGWVILTSPLSKIGELIGHLV